MFTSRAIPITTFVTGIFLGTVVIPQVCFGGSSFTLETLVEVQLQDQLLISSVIPWKATDAVSYGYAYDSSTGAFSFSTNPGQSIADLPFSFSTTAQFDATQATWSWSGTGFIGGTSFQITGAATIFGDPTQTIKGKYHDDKGNEFDATAEVTFEETETGRKSSGTGTAKDKNGKVVKTGKVTDFVSLQNPKGAPWEINFVANDGNGPLFGQGDGVAVGPNQFEGHFVQTAVPEPSTIVMALLGALTLACYAASNRQIGTCSNRNRHSANIPLQ
jgi:hypothetical protein